MDAKICLEKLDLITSLSMATVDKNGIPQNRIISAIYIEDNKFYFYTARGKEFCEQLKENHYVAILGLSKFKEQIRLTGIAKQVSEKNQRKYIDLIFEKYPYLYNVYPDKTNEIGMVFVIEDAGIEYFNLGVRPIFRENYTIGNYKVKEKGFRILEDKCIACGTCKRNCPQNCIVEGEKYKINEENCLHCGNCYEKCPVKAVKKL